MKKILMITAYFYPQNTISVLRVGSWVKYLRKKNKVTVLTTKKYFFNEPLNLPCNFCNDIEIIELPYLPKSLHISREENISSKKNEKNHLSKIYIFLRELLKRVRSVFGNLLDIYNLWAVRGYFYLLGNKKKFDIVISSYNPPASHILAYIYKTLYPDTLWIADYRDLWSINHIARAKGVFHFIEKFIEKQLLKKADIVITVSKELTQQMIDVFDLKEKVFTIENGFDEEEFPFWKERLKIKKKYSGKFKIVYTGTIYEGKQDPVPLIIAFNKLIDENIICRDKISIEFYGKCEKEINNIVLNKKINPHNIVKYKGMVNRSESLDIQKKADMLLFLDWNDISTKGILTGKVFEYIVSGTPILGVGVAKDSAAGRLIKKTQTGILATSVEDIVEILLKIIEKKDYYFYKPNIDEISKYTREKQVKKLLRIINEKR